MLRAHSSGFLLLGAVVCSAAADESICGSSSTQAEEPDERQPESNGVDGLLVSFLQHAHGMHHAKAKGTRTPRAPPNFVIFMPDDMYLVDYMPWDSDTSAAPPAPPSMPPPSKLIPDFGLMPRLEQVARSGATFTRAYTTTSSCTPSRFSILTGRYPSKSRFARWATQELFGQTSMGIFVDEGYSYVNHTDITENLAFALQASGYTTGMMGKWGLTPQPYGGDYSSPYSFQQEQVKAAGFDYADGVYISNQNLCAYPICSTFTHNLEWLLESALEFLDGALTRHAPFFLYFNPTVPHSPPSASDALTEIFNSSTTPAGVLSRPPDVSRYCSSCYMPTREVIWAASQDLYWNNRSLLDTKRSEVASLYWLDLSLGVLHDYLTEKAAIENTYIIVLTDHGPAKGTLFDLGCRVPMYVAGPGIASGTIVAEPVSHVDLAPTVLAWAGNANPMFDMDGLSWASLVAGEASVLDRQEIFLEYQFDRALVTRDGLKYYTVENTTFPAQMSTRDPGAESFKAAYPGFVQGEQLYNISADDEEQTNLAADETYASRLSLLRLHMNHHKIASR